MKKVFVIAGVTASGKSDLALSLAQSYPFEIINIDSVSMYKRLDIGSAKVSLSDRAKVPHHFVDFLEPDEDYDVSSFQRDAREKIEEIYSRGHYPLLVGGSGLYLNAVIYDYRFPEKELVSIPRDMSNEAMHKEIKERDPESARKIHVNNRKRLERTLALLRTYNQPMKEIHGGGKDRPVYDHLTFFLTGENLVLEARMKKRIEKMFASGLEDEVKNLFEDFPNFFETQAGKAIGYHEFKDYFLGNMTLQEVQDLIFKNTKDFAKRQKTWFRNQNDGYTVDIENLNKENIKEAIERYLR